MVSTDNIEEMKELRRQGKSLREIGDLYGISYLAVRRHVDQEFHNRKERRKDIKYNGVKRPKPKGCELCGIEIRLEGHHWDDNHGNMELYLCWHCHRYAEAIDYDKIHGERKRNDYRDLKREEAENYRNRSEDRVDLETGEALGFPVKKYTERQQQEDEGSSLVASNQLTAIDSLRLKMGITKDQPTESDNVGGVRENNSDCAQSLFS